MRASLYRWLLPIGLATASLVGTVETTSAQPTVRDHRNRPADAGPREAPPPIREERVRPKGRGWVWVQGFWDWRNGRWEWTGGRWEKSRQGRRWRPDTWELRNGVYVRVQGDWIDDRPTQAPPSPREERFQNRRGFTWVPGHWDWENGQWQWVAGKYERERRGKRWRNVRWELKDGAWVRVDGSWDEDVPVANPGYPVQGPPPPRDERPGTKNGFVWIRGHYDWRNGSYQWVDGHWERERASERWNDGRWDRRGDRWEWVAGQWERQEPAIDTRGWTMLREHLFDEKNEYRQFDISQKQGRFNRIMLQVLDNDVEIRDVTVVYVDGEKMTPSIRRSFRNGGGTAAIDLGSDKILRAVTMYVKTPGRARVLLWGKWAGGASPPPPTTNQPPPPPRGGPTQPPPAPRGENPGTKGGFVWIRGHYEWRGNQYEWINGHWERERARQRWVDGRWELRGGVYVWSPGYWQ
jgi:hypothetical protein